MKLILPLGMVVATSIIYHICTKSMPKGVNSFASLAICYVVGAIFATGLYYAIEKDANIIKEVGKMNFAPFVLGIMIVGLEGGYIYAYKAGWEISTAFIVQSAFVAIGLLLVGFFMYNEAISLNKIIGIVICLIGLFFINKG